MARRNPSRITRRTLTGCIEEGRTEAEGTRVFGRLSRVIMRAGGTHPAGWRERYLHCRGVRTKNGQSDSKVTCIRRQTASKVVVISRLNRFVSHEVALRPVMNTTIL